MDKFKKQLIQWILDDACILLVNPDKTEKVVECAYFEEVIKAESANEKYIRIIV